MKIKTKLKKIVFFFTNNDLILSWGRVGSPRGLVGSRLGSGSQFGVARRKRLRTTGLQYAKANEQRTIVSLVALLLSEPPLNVFS